MIAPRRPPLPLYFRLIAQLRRTMLDRLSPGAPLPSERELCERFQVSRITVRRALDELVAQGEICKRHGKGAFKTRSESSRVRELVYVVYRTAMLATPGRERAIRALAETAERRGYHLVIKSFHAFAGDDNFCDFACRNLHGGLLLSVQELSETLIRRLQRQKVPCVFLNHAADYAVRADFRQAGALAAAWVVRRQFQNILLLLPPADLPDTEAFQAGFADALPAKVNCAVRHTEYDRAMAAATLRSMLRETTLPDAVVAGDDLLAAGALDALRAFPGAKPIPVSGVNDSYLAAELNFSSIDLRTAECAAQAAELLADLIEGNTPPPPAQYVFAPRWHERLSTSSPQGVSE